VTLSTIRPSRALRTFGVLLGLAVLLGVAVSLLVAGAPTPSAPRAGEIVVNLPPVFWGALLLSPLLVGLAAVVFRAAHGRATGLGRTMLVGFGILIVLGVAFMVLLALSHQGSDGALVVGQGTGGPPNSGSGGNPGGGGSSTNGSGTVPGTFVYTVGPWMVVALALAVSACVALLAVPGVLSRVVDRGRRPATPGVVDRRQVTDAFVEASWAIGRGEDFRDTIVRLYVRLLQGLSPKTGDVACLTPEEIRVQAFEHLGVRSDAARDLTRLFEEARYSTHAMGAASADRFRDAVAAIEADLLRGAAR
jgi:Domain of unknown function (DUF4129)